MKRIIIFAATVVLAQVAFVLDGWTGMGIYFGALYFGVIVEAVS